MEQLLSEQSIVDKSFEVFLNYLSMFSMAFGIMIILSLFLDDLCGINNIWKTRFMVSVIMIGLFMFF